MHATRGAKRKAENVTKPTKRNKPDESDMSVGEGIGKEFEDNRPICKYGEKCYQKNSYHLARFRHPQREPSKTEATSSTPILFTYFRKQK